MAGPPPQLTNASGGKEGEGQSGRFGNSLTLKEHLANLDCFSFHMVPSQSDLETHHSRHGEARIDVVDVVNNTVSEVIE